MESLKLEKLSKIIKSNRQPNTTMSDKPCPEVPYLRLFQTPSEMATPPFPGQPGPMLLICLIIRSLPLS